MEAALGVRGMVEVEGERKWVGVQAPMSRLGFRPEHCLLSLHSILIRLKDWEGLERYHVILLSEQELGEEVVRPWNVQGEDVVRRLGRRRGLRMFPVEGHWDRSYRRVCGWGRGTRGRIPFLFSVVGYLIEKCGRGTGYYIILRWEW